MSEYPLSKLFHMSDEEYKKEYERRFNSVDTTKLDIFIGDNQAFFCPDTEIYKLALSIEKTDKRINKLCSVLPERAIGHFTRRCLIDEIVISNNIEGVHSTRKEINDILEDLKKENKRNRFVGLVKKYIAFNTKESLMLNSCADIRKIYDEIFGDEINSENLPDGKIFRKGSVAVYSATGKIIHHGLYPEEKIEDTMNRALIFLKNENIELIFRVAIFHYLFGYIHPFYDGNGRMSRFISSYLLSKGYNKLISYRISYTIKENITAYYNAFKTCNDISNKGDLTPFLKMFLKVVDTSQKQLQKALEKRHVLLADYEKKISYLPNCDDKKTEQLYGLLCQATLFSEIGIGIGELMEYMEISYATLSKKLGNIPDNLLIMNKSGKYKYYLLNLEEIKNY